MLIALCLVVATVCGTVDKPERVVPLEVAVPRRQTARYQLEYARRLKERLGERKPAEQTFWRGLAIEAYQAVRVHHPEEKSIAAEAAFRAGELLRATNDVEAAAVEFDVAAELGRGGPFECRALMEHGHLYRRAGELRRALDYFHDVVSHRTTSVRLRDDAWFWIGRMQRDLGRFDDAVRAWKTISMGEGDALDRVEAFNWWANLLIDRGDLNGAAGVLNACQLQLLDWSLEETQFGRRVRRALERMRARRRLIDALEQRHRDKRNSSSNDPLPRKS